MGRDSVGVRHTATSKWGGRKCEDLDCGGSKEGLSPEGSSGTIWLSNSINTTGRRPWMSVLSERSIE